MKIGYGVTGKDRKALVMAIAEITGADAIFLKDGKCLKLKKLANFVEILHDSEFENIQQKK